MTSLPILPTLKVKFLCCIKSLRMDSRQTVTKNRSVHEGVMTADGRDELGAR